jgi:hypothetical protein
MGILAITKGSDIEDRCVGGTKCPPETHSDIDSGQTLGTISTISFIVAGVGVGVLVTGLLGVGRSEAKASALYVTPAGVAGRF